jgi:membrane protease YdiL (CAAX protease family)
MKTFATKHPLLFVLATTLVWILASLVFVILASAGMNRPIDSGTVQSIGTLLATGLVLFVTWRLGWLKAAGFTRVGGWQVWLVSLGILLYIYLTYRYSFFGTIDPDLTRLRTSSAQGIILRHLVVGFVEEALFRGVLLYALVRVWGGTRRGIFASALVTALLFGSLHIFQLLTGNILPSTLVVMLGASLAASGWPLWSFAGARFGRPSSSTPQATWWSTSVRWPSPAIRRRPSILSRLPFLKYHWYCGACGFSGACPSARQQLTCFRPVPPRWNAPLRCDPPKICRGGLHLFSVRPT